MPYQGSSSAFGQLQRRRAGRLEAGDRRGRRPLRTPGRHLERVLAQDRLDAGDRIALTLKVYQRAADVLVTGSARLSAFHAGGDSLMGRYFSYRMHPLSVAELARPELGPPPGERAPAAVDDDAFGALIEFGGFPEPLQRQDRRFANRWRRLRHQQLFREELRDLTRIQETAKVQTLAQLVIQRAGQLTSYSSLAAAVGATVDSVRRWLSVLESFYFCFAVRPWHGNVARVPLAVGLRGHRPAGKNKRGARLYLKAAIRPSRRRSCNGPDPQTCTRQPPNSPTARTAFRARSTLPCSQSSSGVGWPPALPPAGCAVSWTSC